MRKKLQKVLVFLKRNWFWDIVFLIALAGCIINIFYACRVCNYSNLFTAISGWVSGIATIILGIVAIVQNRKYKEENDAFMKRQKEENASLITRQTNCTIFNNVVNQRCNFIDLAKRRLNEFIKEYDFKKITMWLAELHIEANNTKLVIDDQSQAVLINLFYNRLIIDGADLIQFIKNDWCLNAENEKMAYEIESYIDILSKLQPKSYDQIPRLIEKFNETCNSKFLNLIGVKNQYITWLDADLNMVLLTKTGDIEFVKRHYGFDKEQNNEQTQNAIDG